MIHDDGDHRLACSSPSILLMYFTINTDDVDDNTILGNFFVRKSFNEFQMTKKTHPSLG